MDDRAYPCPICGYYTVDAPRDWDICPICFWEDDVRPTEGGRTTSPANRGMSMATAQANFVLFGAVERHFLLNSRRPSPGEKRDPNWRLFPEAEEMIRRARAEN